MLVDNFITLGKHVNTCPCCGNDSVGNNTGKLIMDDTYMIRTCRCGFLFYYDEKWGMDKEKIEEAVHRARQFNTPYTGTLALSHQKLRAVRKANNELLYDMAVKLDIKSSELSKYEHGKEDVPDIILHRLEMVYPELREERT